MLESEGKLLLVERAAGLTFAGQWCFPGGHVEDGETSRDAVIRELHEELGVAVEPIELLGTVRVTGYRLDAWRVRLLGGTLRAREAEIAAFTFLTIDEVRSHPTGMPSNGEVLRLLGR